MAISRRHLPKSIRGDTSRKRYAESSARSPRPASSNAVAAAAIELIGQDQRLIKKSFRTRSPIEIGHAKKLQVNIHTALPLAHEQVIELFYAFIDLNLGKRVRLG